jgi:WD40 repeat protein/DNA-binding SARP family transcriptional activator
MTTLALTCLGAFTLRIADQPVSHFPTDKVQALLVYLALEPHAHRREALAALFWPEIGEEYALKNLRSTLYRLRQTIEEVAPGLADRLLLANRQTVELAADSVQADVLAFERLLHECARHAHAGLAQCDLCLTNLTQAVAFYGGELWAGFGLADAPAFEEWLLLRREALQQQLLQALGHLVDAYRVRGDLETATIHATRQLTIDPLREDVLRQIMRLFAQRGLPQQALAHYATCRTQLRQELGVEPDPETTALAEQIRRGKIDKVTGDKVTGEGVIHSPPHLVTLSPPHRLYDWGEMPAVDFFAGRTTEMAQLKAWLTPPATAGAAGVRLATIVGLGGMGKTTLAAAAVKVVAPLFATVIWRSLLNAPPLADILRNWLQILSRQTLIPLPEALDDQLRQLLHYLRQTRCLLVLDNVESILQPGDDSGRAGEPRPGYEGYAQLFQRLAESEHQSTLLLTTREQPAVLHRFGRQSQPEIGAVRRLALLGVTLPAGHAILQSNGLLASSQEAELLVQHYSGNPLALQLVATTIADFFAGNVAAFLQEEGMFFEGIRVVLDQQFARLSPLEHDILVWLAIEREAVTVPMLRSNLLQTRLNQATGSALLDALHALQQRSLIEKSDSGLTLQNVIIEYTTEYLVEQVCQEIVDGKVTRWQGDGSTELAEVKVTSDYPVTLSFLNRFALLKAQSKEYVRQSQARLLVQPLAERLVAKFGLAALTEALQAILARLQQQLRPLPGYVAGNLLNLLLHLGCDVRGYDFARLTVWQAHLREATLFDVNFAQADLSGSSFRKPFTFIWAVAYSPDGQYIAGGGLDGAVFLWQTSDGQAVHVYQGQTALVYTLAFSHAGQWLAGGGEDKTICVWDRQNGQLRYRLADHSGFVNAVAFSPDGALLASASDDRTVRVWDMESGRAVYVFAEHRARVNSVAFDPAGALLVSGSDDGSVQLWDAISGRLIHRWVVSTQIFTVAFDPAGAFVVGSGEDAIVRCWEIATGELRHTLRGHTGDVRSVALRSDGALLASGGGDETVRFWDVQSGDCVQVIHAHQRCVTTVAFSPDGKTVASSSHDGAVCLSDVQTGRLLQTLNGYGTEVVALACQASGDLLAATLDNQYVRIWDAPTGYPRHLLPGYCKEVHASAFHPQQPIFVSGCDDTYVRVWDLARGRQRWLCQGHTQGVVAVAISQDGARVASYAGDGQVRIWDTPAAPLSAGAFTAARAPLQRLIACPAQQMFTLVFSPDGAYLAGGYEAGIYLWRVASGETLPLFTGQTLGTVSLAFSPDGTWLANGRDDHTIALWSVASGELRSVLRHHQGTIYALAFSPDGKVLASASGDHQLALWDGQAGTLLQSCRGHHSRVLSVVFYPDGQRVASGSFDGVVKCWDVQRGACLETFYAKGPYAGMKIAGATGITEAQKAALRALGAVEE